MDMYITPTDLAAHLSYVVLALSYLMTSMVWLRALAILGLALEIVYFTLSGSSWRTNLPWDLIFILINAYALAMLMRERGQATLTGADAPVLREAFEGLNDGQIIKLLRAADAKDAAVGEVITRQDAPVDALYFILSGRAKVERDGQAVSHLGAGAFVGEMAYLSRNPAASRVTVDEPMRLLSFSRVRLAKVTAGDKEISNILYQVLGRDLTQKMRQASTRRVLEQEPLVPGA